MDSRDATPAKPRQFKRLAGRIGEASKNILVSLQDFFRRKKARGFVEIVKRQGRKSSIMQEIAPRRIAMIRPLLVLQFALAATAAAAGPEPATVLLLQFDESYSSNALAEMKHEVQNIFKASRVRFEWRFLSEVKKGESFADLIVVRFTGHCAMGDWPASVRTGDALAQTHMTNGELLPFTDVLCDKVRAAVIPALNDRDRERADTIMGRALGRALAHELYHIVAKTRKHSLDGVNREVLSGSELVSSHLTMNASDLRKLADESVSRSRSGSGESESSLESEVSR
jgi:hypothetical protein